jgi:hypothetical protein
LIELLGQEVKADGADTDLRRHLVSIVKISGLPDLFQEVPGFL